MLDMNDLNSLDEILDWFEEAVNKTQYGVIGVEVRVARGKLIFINPKYHPALKMNNDDFDNAN